MAQLITTKQQLKKAVSNIDADFEYETIRTYIDDAEYEMLERRIGKDVLDKILAKSSEDPDDKVVLLAMKVVGNYAFTLWLPTGNLRTSSTGVALHSDPNQKIASDRKVLNALQAYKAAAYMALERLYALLDNNESYPEFADTEANKLAKNLFVSDSKTLNTYYNINYSRLVYENIIHLVRDMQDNVVTGIIGSNTMTYLLSDIETNERTVGILRNAIVWLSIAEAMTLQQLVVNEYGVVELQIVSSAEGGTNYMPDSKNKSTTIANKLKDKSMGLLNKCLQEFSLLETGELFNALLADGKAKKTINPETALAIGTSVIML